MESLLNLLEPFRRIVAGRTGIIGLPSRLSIINCCLSEEGKLEALGRRILDFAAKRVKRERLLLILSLGIAAIDTNA